MKWPILFFVIGIDFVTKWMMRIHDVHNFGIYRFEGLFFAGAIFTYMLFYTALTVLLKKSSGTFAFGMALLAGGTFANGIQFLWQGSATDWIHVPLFSDFSLYTNIADIFILVGLVVSYTSFIARLRQSYYKKQRFAF